MRTLIAVPKSSLGDIYSAIPGAAQIFGEQGVELREDLVEEVANIKQRIDYILYSGHLPLESEASYSYFEDSAAGENTDYWTNIKVPGQVPFSGTYKINGLGMFVTPTTLTTASQIEDLPLITDGWLNFQVGSSEGSILKLPLHAIFTQNIKCCTGSSAVNQFISNSVFSGKYGFYPLPNAPRIKSGTNFKVEVNWGTTWVAKSDLKMFLYIFGKRETKIMQ